MKFELKKNLSTKLKVSLKYDKNNRYFIRRSNILTFMIISHLILFRMKYVSGKCCKENKNTFMFNSFFFSKIAPFMR
jgi:hypothetical protein